MTFNSMRLSNFLSILFACVTTTAATSKVGLDGKPDLRCGEYCLFLALKTLEIDVPSLKEMKDRLGQPSGPNYSFEELATVAKGYGAHTLSVRTSLEEIQNRKGRFACIALLAKENCYVCIYDIDDSFVYITNPPSKMRVQRDAFNLIWNGEALLISEAELNANQRSFTWLIITAILGTLGVATALVVGWRRTRRLIKT